MATKSDYYDLLGVSKNASANEIKKAYRKQALEWHPDRHKDNKEEAEKRFKEINEAYQVLSDSQKKSAYDQFGHAAFTPGGGFANQGGFSGQSSQGGKYGPFTYTYTTSGGSGEDSPFSGFDFGDPFDIFEQFFGGTPFRQTRQLPRYGITIDFMEAVKGIEKEVKIEGKKRKIKIPAGVDDGSRISFNDFILSINVRSHGAFEREGYDIYLKFGIPFSLATLGGEVKVPTIDSDVKLKIRPGTQTGTTIRLRGKGVQSPYGREKGDEYVRIFVIVPEKLNREQKGIIDSLKKEGF